MSTSASTLSAGFAPIGDVRIYYEVQGAGDAILFMHGGGGSIHHSWPTEYVSELSPYFTVIMADSRGQGQSTDGAGPITFGRLAFDAVQLLDHLGITSAHLVGHSAGAVASLHLLVDFPDRVKTATLMACGFHIDHYRPEGFVKMRRDLEALLRGEVIESRLSSRPLSVVRKLQSAWLAGPAFTPQLLQTIGRPTLIVTAGRDGFFAPTVGDAMYSNIKGSELIHYPDATHHVQVTNRHEIISAIRDFIARRGDE
jgi:pimeloyl-ACP methyl ester carboxylesterase